MKIYNTLGKGVVEFKPQVKNQVKMYVCGPTVYDYAHLGNLRTYLNEDFLRRFLEYLGYQVHEVMNITDIEDKIIAKANQQGVPYKKVTQKYENIFFDNLTSLNIEPPNSTPHATDPDVIEEMIKIITDLLDKEYAYKSDDGSIYFSINKFKDYGQLSNVDLTNVMAGARVSQDEYGKENVQDFAIWKKAKDDEPIWDATFGKGRPGWHIECSAMNIKYLGTTIDIHGGGVDLIFPHHENEIAISQAYTGKPFVNYWFHPEHLLVNGQRMAKSLNNYYTLDDLVDKFGVEPLAFRMMALSSNYREKLNFTEDSINQAQNTLNNLRDFVLKNKEEKNKGLETDKFKNQFLEALNNDLNLPMALASLFNLVKEVNKTNKFGQNVYQFLIEIDKILGLGLDKLMTEEIPVEVDDLVAAREQARKDKDWTLADNIRENIENLGYEIEDTEHGSKQRRNENLQKS